MENERYEIDMEINHINYGTYGVCDNLEEKYLIEGLKKYQADFILELLKIKNA